MIAHPTEVLPTRELVVVVAGPTLYLVAHILFRLRLARSLTRKRLVAAVACVAVGLVGIVVPALAVSALLDAVLVILIASEHASGRRRRSRGEPSPLERLGAAA